MAAAETFRLNRGRWFGLVALLAALLGSGGALWVRHQARVVRNDKFADLATIGRLKAEAIAAWRAERLGDAAVLTENVFLGDAVSRWLADPATEPSGRIAAYLRTVAQIYGYSDVLVVDRDGTVRLSLSGRTEPHAGASQALAEALRDRRPAFSDLHTDPGDPAPHIAVVAPLGAAVRGSAAPIGAIILVNDARQFLYPFIQRWPVPSRTAETLLVERRGDEIVFLNDLRFHGDAALKLRFPSTRTDVAAVQAVFGRVGPFEGEDYRGVPVLADLRPVPGSPWFIVAKVDRAEILAELRQATAVAAVAVVGLVLLAGIGTGFLYKARGKAFFKELHRTERERRIALEELETTLHAIGDAVIATDAEGRVRIMNPVAESLTGWRQAEAENRPLVEVFPIVSEDSRQPIEDPVARVLQEGVVVGLANHTVLIARDGAEHPIADSAAPIRGEGGEVTGVVLVFRDQTADRETARRLQESERRYRTFIDSTSDMVFLKDEAFRYVISNRVNCAFLGFPEERVLGLTDFDLMPAALAEGCRASDRAAVERREAVVSEETVGDRIFQTVKFPVELIGGRVGVGGYIRDVTDRKRAEDALHESEQRFRSFFDGAPIGKSVTAPDGTLLRVNPALCQMLGYSAEELTARTFVPITHPDDLADSREHIRASLAGEGDSWSLEKRYIAKDGRVVWAHVTTRLQRDGEGAPLYFLTHVLDINEQRRAQEALRTHEERLRTTLRSIGDAVITTDLQGRVESLNPVAESLTGWSESAAAGRPLAEVFHIRNEDTGEAMEDPVARVLREGAIVSLANHTMLVARNGARRPIADSGAPIRDQEGAITGVVLVFRDQTAERAAQRARLLLTDTIRSLVDEIYLFDADTLRFRFVNDGARHNLGYTLDQLKEMTPLDLKPEFTAESFAALVQPLRNGESPRQIFETVHRRADGTLYPVEVHLQLFDHFGDTVFLAVIQDITLRRRAEEELRASQDAFRAISDGAPVMICVVDEQRRVLTGNRAFQEASGWPNTELGSDLACGALGCIGSLDDARGCGFGPRCATCPLRLAIQDTLATGTPHRDTECRTTLLRRGQPTEVVLLASTNAFEIGGQRRLVLCLIDITERRNLEEQLRQAQKMEAIGTLAGGIAHDFNNLLQALLSSTQAARLQAKEPALEKALAEIQAHTQRGAALTRQLLLFSRQAPVHKERLDLGALVADHASMLRRLLPEDITLVVEVGDEPLPVEVDAGQIGQVLTNLVVNARDAMPGGGRLAVTTSLRGSDIVLQVVDDGAGMTAEVRERIFDPFFTTKAHGKGTGLGLAVVWGIAKEHGGRVEAESEPGRGSTFRVVLPVASGPGLPAPAADAEEELPTGSGERVLLVEDEDGARQGLAELLAVLRYTVTAVASAEEASALPAAPAFDLLLTDYRLPGATGLEIAQELSGRWPNLKVVVMSGYASDDLARELFAGGTVHFLQKPFDMASLARALRTTLALSRVGPS